MRDLGGFPSSLTLLPASAGRVRDEGENWIGEIDTIINAGMATTSFEMPPPWREIFLFPSSIPPSP
jgi:hypothetical protein